MRGRLPRQNNKLAIAKSRKNRRKTGFWLYLPVDQGMAQLGAGIMKRSDRRILTSHVGSLPRPDALIEINRLKFAGEAYDAAAYAATLSAAVEEVCRQQA